jgi:alkylation response protein AidB-like acyl-CoA dehydrogenase
MRPAQRELDLIAGKGAIAGAAIDPQTTRLPKRCRCDHELGVAQEQTVVSNIILEAATFVFDALGASATIRTAALDRFWRNARTLPFA